MISRDGHDGCKNGDCGSDIKGDQHDLASGQQTMKVNRRRLMFSLALVLSPDCDACNTPEVVIGILSRSVDQQIFLLVNEILPFILAHLKIRRELDGVGRARLLAVAAEDTARKVDAKEVGVATPMLILGSLERDAINRARNGTEIARDTALAAIRIARQNDPTAVPGR
jgi:hypothetical protein